MAERSILSTRPECLGFLGFLLGHRYPERWSYTEEVFKQVEFCTRCGMVAELVPLIDGSNDHG